MRGSRVVKVISWLAIGLTLNLCTCQLCPAQETTPTEIPNSDERPDTTMAAPETNGTGSDTTDVVTDTTMVEQGILELNPEIFPYSASGDSLGPAAGPESRAIYREWWLWTVAVAVLATTIILYSGGDEAEADEDLPGFPEPPEH
jgi:hypothetical protein